MCLLSLLWCLCVSMCRPRFPSFRIPPFVLPWGRHASYISPSEPPLTLLTATTNHHQHHYLFLSLSPFLVSVLPWRHMSVSSLVLPVSRAALFHWVSLSVCLSVSFSVCLCAFGLPFFACSLFICFLFYVSARPSDWLFFCVCPCLCLLSVSFFFLFFSPAHWLPVWPPGFSTSNPSSPLSALLLCSNVPPNINLSLLSFSPPTHLFVPTSKQYPLNVTGNTQYKKESERERKKGGI